MNFKLKVFPYKLGSQSAKALASALGVKRVRSTYDAKRRDVIINWGNSSPAQFKSNLLDLNSHTAIALACNKVSTFKTLEDHGFEHLPSWCTTSYEANNMLYCATNGGETLGKESIYCRTTVTGHSGNGIVIAKNTLDFVEASLYTLGTKHKYEFRVHVFRGKVLDVQQKKRKFGIDNVNPSIRNHSNGWIYARSNIDIPPVITQASLDAVHILGLDFGAVDIGYRERDGKAFVFEVNTAPGLVGTTLTKYVDAFTSYLRELNG